MITVEQIARLTGLTPEVIEEDKKKRQFIRSKTIAQFAIHSIIDDEMRHVARGALYHAGKLMIGCEPKARIITGSRGNNTGERYTPYHTWPESSAYQRGLNG